MNERNGPVSEYGDDFAVEGVGQSGQGGQDPHGQHDGQSVRRSQPRLQRRQNDPVAVDGDGRHGQRRHVDAHDLHEGHQRAEQVAEGPVMEQDARHAERDVETGHEQVGEGHVHQERVRDRTQAAVAHHHVADEQVAEQGHGHDAGVGAGDDGHLQRFHVHAVALVLLHERRQVRHRPVVPAPVAIRRPVPLFTTCKFHPINRFLCVLDLLWGNITGFEK